MERFEIFISHKCLNIRTVPPGRQPVKDYRSVQCTEASLAVLTDQEQHRNERETVFILSLSNVPIR